jgi:hypothetical protein
VVGRHSQASLRAHAENLSLRHLLLLGRAGALTELIPLVSAQRVRAWSRPLPPRLAARCIAFDLDCALLLIAPELEGAAAPVLQRPAASGLGAARKPARTPERNQLRGSGEHTIVTIARDLSLVPDEPAGLRPLALSVRTDERSVSVGVREDWLEQGLILGRKPEKCSHRAFHDLLSEDDHISRCHLYLRREADEVVFYDTASTSGLWLGEECVQRVAIPAPRAACEGAGDAALINPEHVVIALTDRVSVTLTAADPSARARSVRA